MKSRNQTKGYDEIYLRIHLSANRKRAEDAKGIYRYEFKEIIHTIIRIISRIFDIIRIKEKQKFVILC